jgi:hypothetical protein
LGAGKRGGKQENRTFGSWYAKAGAQRGTHGNSIFVTVAKAGVTNDVTTEKRIFRMVAWAMVTGMVTAKPRFPARCNYGAGTVPHLDEAGGFDLARPACMARQEIGSSFSASIWTPQPLASTATTGQRDSGTLPGHAALVPVNRKRFQFCDGHGDENESVFLLSKH